MTLTEWELNLKARHSKPCVNTRHERHERCSEETKTCKSWRTQQEDACCLGNCIFVNVFFGCPCEAAPMTRWPWLRWVDISTTKSRGSQPLLPSSPATFRNAQTTTWHHILKCWNSTKMREKHGKLKKTFKIGFDSEFLSLCLNDSECMSLCPAMPYSLPHRFTHCRHSADSQSPLLPKWTVVCQRHWTHSEVSVEEGPSEVNTWDIHISHNARCSRRESKPCDLKTCKCNAVKNY